MTASVYLMFDHPARQRREVQTMKGTLADLHMRRVKLEGELSDVSVQIGELAALIQSIEAAPCR